MKKMFTILLVFGFTISMAKFAFAQCAIIQDGTIYTTDPASQVITPGYDDYGYNYQAHMYNGDYCDNRRSNNDACPTVDAGHVINGPGDVDLMMKWNDAWLSNKDCDIDGKLDRHYGSTTYIGSGAWLTNHMSGKVVMDNGKMRKWTYFVKIVAVPSDATKTAGIWYAASGTEIGPDIWGQFAIIQEVSNDPSNGAHGILYNSPAGPGFGQY